jgi:CO/xanthine dehydrogenase Mo-binding subunit
VYEVDHIANDIGMDPLQFRLQNLAANRSKRTLELISQKVGLERKNGQSPHQKLAMLRYGIGMAVVIGWSFGYAYMPWSAATIRLLGDGNIAVAIGIGDTGTGSKTILAQIAAGALGLNMDQVKISAGDTTLPFDEGSYSSRVTICGGTAVYLAAQDLKARLIEAVAPMLNLTAPELTSKMAQ